MRQNFIAQLQCCYWLCLSSLGPSYPPLLKNRAKSDTMTSVETDGGSTKIRSTLISILTTFSPRRHKQVQPSAPFKPENLPENPCRDEKVGKKQVWSLSSFKVSCQLSTNDLNQVSSVLMTSSTALTNKGLFELSQCPLLTRAVSLSCVEILRN